MKKIHFNPDTLQPPVFRVNVHSEQKENEKPTVVRSQVQA